VPFHVGIQIRNVRCLVAATRMAASIDFHDRFGEPELTALGRSATVDSRVACRRELLVTNDRSDACVLRLAA
jgi:hypothetical protein